MLVAVSGIFMKAIAEELIDIYVQRFFTYRKVCEVDRDWMRLFKWEC